MKMSDLKRNALLLALLLTLCAAPPALARSYGLGDEADTIAAIQTALEELDFYYADITGRYGKRTQAAVRKFQKRYGLAQTGVADEETTNRILEKAGIQTPAGNDAVLPSASSSTLREGTRSDAVRILQENLTLLEFYSGSITGSYGRLTKEAVRQFQKANDLAADGIAGPRTLGRLTEILVGGNANESPVITLPQTENTADAAIAVSLQNVDALNTERTLRRTSRSGYVTRLQKALSALGYYAGKIDGYFGSETETAVKAFQTAKGLTADGVAGRATLRAINSDVKNGVTAQQTSID